MCGVVNLFIARTYFLLKKIAVIYFAGLCDNRCCGLHLFLWLLTFIPALLLLLRTTSWQNAESLPANSASTVQVPSYVTRNLKLKENSRRSGVGRAFFPSPRVVRLSLIRLSMSMMLQVHESATKEGCRSCIVNIASRVMEENLVVCVLSEGGKFGFFLFCDAEVATGKRGEEEMWRCVLHSSLAKDMAFRYDKRVWLDVAAAAEASRQRTGKTWIRSSSSPRHSQTLPKYK